MRLKKIKMEKSYTPSYIRERYGFKGIVVKIQCPVCKKTLVVTLDNPDEHNYITVCPICNANIQINYGDN